MDDLIFTAEILNHCPENGRRGLLMYINENVFDGGVFPSHSQIQKLIMSPSSVWFCWGGHPLVW